MPGFTYLIGWSKENLWYYGCRYAESCHPSDLWTTYFTSSKIVSILRRTIGEPNVRKIRKVFEIGEDAVKWEHKVLRRLRASQREDFLNLQNGSGDIVPKHDALMRQVVSEKCKKYWTEDKRKSASKQKIQYFKEHGTKKMSDWAKARYTEVYRAAHVEKMTIVNRTIEKRNAASKKLKENWKDPAYKEKMKHRKHGASNSDKLKTLWKDPVWRTKMLECRKQKRVK